MAKHSFMTSSITLRIRKRRPPESWSWTKSTDQRAFGRTRLGSALETLRRAFLPCAFAPSGLPRDRAVGPSCGSPNGLRRAAAGHADGDSQTDAARPPALASDAEALRPSDAGNGSERSSDRPLSGDTPGVEGCAADPMLTADVGVEMLAFCSRNTPMICSSESSIASSSGPSFGSDSSFTCRKPRGSQQGIWRQGTLDAARRDGCVAIPQTLECTSARADRHLANGNSFRLG